MTDSLCLMSITSYLEMMVLLIGADTVVNFVMRVIKRNPNSFNSNVKHRFTTNTKTPDKNSTRRTRAERNTSKL